MRINTNMAALNAWRNLSASGANLSKSLERLSSGNRINRAADDAAGLAVSEKMDAQIRGINMATRNTQDGISLVQTAEGGASKIQDMLQRMRELSVQSSSGSLEDKDRTQLQNEFEELAKEIDRTAKNTKFNNQALLDGTTNAQSATTTYTPGTATSQNSATVAVYGTPDTSSGTFQTTPPTGSFKLQVKAVESTGDTTADSYTFELLKDDGTGTFATTGYTASATSLNGTVKLGGLVFDVGGTAAPTVTSNATGPALDIATFNIAATTTGASSKFTVQVGANNGDTIDFNLDKLDGAALGVTNGTGTALATGLSIGSQSTAQTAIDTLDTALDKVSSARAKMGAYQNRLDNAVSTLQTQSENLTAAQSRIKDVDMASEMAQFTKYQVLQQAGTAMLAQANQLPQGVMSLLRG